MTVAHCLHQAKQTVAVSIQLLPNEDSDFVTPDEGTAQSGTAPMFGPPGAATEAVEPATASREP